VLDEMDRTWLPVVNSWRLNERHYGALQDSTRPSGQAVWRCASADLAAQLRHGAAGASAHRPALRARRRALRKLAPEQVPLTECLKDTVARVMPFWNEALALRCFWANAWWLLPTATQSGAGQVPRQHLRQRHRGPEYPQWYSAGL